MRQPRVGTRGIVREHHPGSQILACNGVADHIHVLVDLHQSSPLADFVRDIKARTSASLNRANTGPGRFSWQNGYAAFSCSYRETFPIIRYIERQEIHHQEEDFLNEYVRILRENGIEYAHLHPGDRLV